MTTIMVAILILLLYEQMNKTLFSIFHSFVSVCISNKLRSNGQKVFHCFLTEGVMIFHSPQNDINASNVAHSACTCQRFFSIMVIPESIPARNQEVFLISVHLGIGLTFSKACATLFAPLIISSDRAIMR